MLPSSLGYAHARRTLDMAGKGTFKREDYTATGRRLSCGLLLLLAEMAGGRTNNLFEPFGELGLVAEAGLKGDVGNGGTSL
jgi:hypothetical protein